MMINTQHTQLTIDELIQQVQNLSVLSEALPLIKILAEEKNQTGILALIELLHHHHPEIVGVIAKELEQLAPLSVEFLIAAYHSCINQNVQAHIVRILACIGDERGLDLLIDVVGVEVANHCQGNVRRVAARGLEKMIAATNDAEKSQRAINKLSWALLNAEDWALRYAAAISLGAINQTSHASVKINSTLVQALEQESDRVVRERISILL